MMDAARAVNIVQRIKVEYGKVLQETVNLIKQRREMMEKMADPMTHWAVREDLRTRLECTQELLDQSIIEYGVWTDVYNILLGSEVEND